MKLYHIAVEREDDWVIGRVLEREGITTQAKTLDELVLMVRDAIELMWSETGVHLELIIPGEAKPKRSSSAIVAAPRRVNPKLAKVRQAPAA